MMRPRRRSSNIRLALYLLVLVLIAGYLVNRQRGATSNEDLTYEEDLGTYAHTSKSRKGERAFVVASQEKDDVAWLYDYFPDWTKYRYIVDNPKAELRVPINKGRESMVYLTYVKHLTCGASAVNQVIAPLTLSSAAVASSSTITTTSLITRSSCTRRDTNGTTTILITTA